MSNPDDPSHIWGPPLILRWKTSPSPNIPSSWNSPTGVIWWHRVFIMAPRWFPAFIEWIPLILSFQLFQLEGMFGLGEVFHLNIRGVLNMDLRSSGLDMLINVLRYPRLYIYPISTSILTLISSYFYLDIHSQSTVVIQLYLEFHSLYYSASCFRLSFSVSSRTLKWVFSYLTYLSSDSLLLWHSYCLSRLLSCYKTEGVSSTTLNYCLSSILTQWLYNKVLEFVHCTTQLETGRGFRHWLQLMHCT